MWIVISIMWIVQSSTAFEYARVFIYILYTDTKAMVMGRKPKKIDIRIKGESIEQVNSFKYFGCNVSSNMNCCQEVKQRIAMAKEAFNRKIGIFWGPWKKKLRKRLVKCFVWSVVLYGAETWTLRRNEQKQLEAIEMWVWRRMERVK